MRSVSRRDFLHRSAGLAAALAGAAVLRQPAHAEEEAKAVKKGEAGDRLRVAVVGVKGRGMSHVHGFAGKNNCVVTTVCDCDEAVIGNAMRDVEKAQGKAPKYEKDLRKVVEDKSIDVISIATPNHWHALAAIWAMQNNKDVYVEKPVSHNVSEGRRMVETARKFNRICQTGTQSRSAKGMREAMAYLHAGKLGKVTLARGLCYKLRGSIGKTTGEQPVPKSVDYDLWCGPAPKRPLRRESLHYDWHWTWDYGNGDLGNQGIHEMDKARWGLNKNELPKTVVSVGGRYGYDDDGETANTQVCIFDYGDCQLIFEVRGLPSDNPYPFGYTKKGSKRGDNFVGNVYYGSEGILVCPSYTSGVVFTPDGQVVREFSGGEDHFANFVKAVRSRKVEDLNADILEGHLSSALCHLGNVSYRLGKTQSFGKKAKTGVLGEGKEANETFARMEEHLKGDVGPISKLSYRLGRTLTLDPKSETIVNDKEANASLTREYRKGFEVPEKV